MHRLAAGLIKYERQRAQRSMARHSRYPPSSREPLPSLCKPTASCLLPSGRYAGCSLTKFWRKTRKEGVAAWSVRAKPACSGSADHSPESPRSRHPTVQQSRNVQESLGWHQSDSRLCPETSVRAGVLKT